MEEKKFIIHFNIKDDAFFTVKAKTKVEATKTAKDILNKMSKKEIFERLELPLDMSGLKIKSIEIYN
jgi:hypothetical protein